MVVTYCTADEVSQFLQRKALFDGTTNPLKTTVEAIINRKEDFIDRYTNHAFRGKTASLEYHDFPSAPSWKGRSWDGLPVFLAHRVITTLATGQGDKVEVFDGSNWIDWLVTRTEGREADFWIEQDKGILWMRTLTSFTKRRSIRVTYRYGESTVPGEINDACIMLTARDLVLNDDRGLLIPDTGTSQVPYIERTERWKKDAYEILDSWFQWTFPDG